MNRQAIRQIAQEMRAELPAIGRTERTLPERTILQLLHRNDVVQLLVGHPDHYPDKEDADEIAALFGVAAYTEPKACQPRIAAQDGHSISVRALAYIWREPLEQAA